MGPAEGLDRDVAVIGAVREAIGEGCALFADANNGYTLNGAVSSSLAPPGRPRLGWLKNPKQKTRFSLRRYGLGFR